MIITLYIIIAGTIAGYEKVWFVGDSFITRSYQKYYREKEHSSYAGYVKENFQITGYRSMSDRYTSMNPNLIGRMQNCLVLAIQEEVLLPKMVVMVLDEDLIQFLDLKEPPEVDITRALARMINAIMVDCD